MAKKKRPVIEREEVVVKFVGDSGDGMQLTGDRFTTSSALVGNDLSTFPDFPAEIRAPAGTLAGVSDKKFMVEKAGERLLVCQRKRRPARSSKRARPISRTTSPQP